MTKDKLVAQRNDLLQAVRDAYHLLRCPVHVQSEQVWPPYHCDACDCISRLGRLSLYSYIAAQNEEASR